MNFKKLTAWLLAAVMVVSLMPMASFAESMPADSGSDTSYEEQLDEEVTEGESETEAASSEEDQPAEPTAAEMIQAKIDALPSVEDLKDIAAEEAAELNSTVTAISLEIDALTEEEKAILVMDKIIAAAGFLATWTAPVEDTTGEDNTGLVVKYRLTENGVVTTDWTAIENQNETVSDTSRYIILDYSKNAVLEVEAYYNGVKLGKRTENVGIGETSQGHKNAYIYDGHGNRGDNGQGSTNWNAKFVDEDGLVTVKPGERNGSTFIQMDIYETAESTEPVYFRIGLTVTGYVLAPTPNTSWYLNATIIPVTDKNAVVEVCSTNATSIDAAYTEKGFYISDGKVYLNAQGKTENLFDITVDDKNYSVVVVNKAAESAEMDARKITLTNEAPTTVENLGTGYKTVNFDNMDSQTWQAGDSLDDGGFKLVKTGDTSYTYYPIYIVKADNNNLVDVEDSAQVKLLSGSVNWFNVEKVDLTINGTTAKAFRLSIAPPDGSTTVVPTLYAKATVGLFTANEATKELGLSIYSLDKFANDELSGTYYKNIFWKYGVSEPVHDYLDEKWDRPQTAVAIERTFDEINGTEPFVDIVLTKGSGSPLYVENVLYDEVYADTFEVVTKTDSKLDIKFTSVDSKGKNCIGITIALKEGVDTTTDISEEFKIRFKATDPNLANFDNYIYGSVLICKDPEIVTESATVNNADELVVAYKTMTTGTITLAKGTYTFTDTFVHDRNTVKLVGAEGAEVVFNRPADSVGPVITVSGNTKDGIIKNIIVDGSDERIGVYGVSTGAYITLENVTVRNCTTGVVNETQVGDTVLTNCTFENNTVGVKSHMDAPDVLDGTFKGNDTAVYVESHTFSIPVIKNSNFIDNTTDLTTESESTQVAFQQNYFGTTASGRKAEPDITSVGNGNKDIVYYTPFYETAERNLLVSTTVGAQVEEVATFAARTTAKNLKYTLPVDLTINPASEMTSNIFAEITKTESYIDNVVVEIPVTSADGEVIWQFSNDTLADAADFNPATDETNIAVGDSLVDGATVVANNKGDATVYHELSFAHNGKLPGQATVTVDGEYKDVNETLYLYHIVGDKLELVENGIAAIEVVGSGEDKKLNYTVVIDGCSEYIISTKIVVEESGDNTGDGSTGGGEGEADGTTDGNTGSTGGSTSGSSSSSSSVSTATPAPTATPAAPAQSAAQATATPTVNDFVSALDVEEKLEASATGEAVIDITGKDLVSAKAFELLAENPDKTLVFEADGFKWTFAASDITDANAISGTTFKPAISLDSPNVDEIKALAGDAAEGFTHIYFQHHGKLPGKAKVEIFVGKADAGVTKHVYHYLPERGGFEYMGTTVITQDGWAAFEIYGCSDYILSDVMLDTSLVLEAETEAPAPETNVGDTETEVVPETPAENGGVGTLPIIIIVAVIAVAAIFFIFRRKGEKEE